jgi:hypothetical protein
LSKNQTVGRVIAGLELIAGAIAVGALIAEAISELHKPKIGEKKAGASPAEKPRSFQSQMVVAGTHLIHREQKEGESLHEFLKSRYHGLYLLGRAEHQLDGDELDALSTNLAHWHKLCHQVTGHDSDRALSEWYSTSGQSRTIPLVRLLDNCEVIEKDLDMSVYIVFCLTGKRLEGYEEDIPDSEREIIKRHLSL